MCLPAAIYLVAHRLLELSAGKQLQLVIASCLFTSAGTSSVAVAHSSNSQNDRSLLPSTCVVDY